MDIDHGTEVGGALIIDELAGFVAGEGSPGSVNAPTGFVWLAASGGLWQRRNDQWDELGRAPILVDTANLETVEDGRIAVTSNGELVVRIGETIYRFVSAGVGSYIGKCDFSDVKNSHWIGVYI